CYSFLAPLPTRSSLLSLHDALPISALRAAMGAERKRIVRQLLTEHLLLGCLGGVAALGVGWAALEWILALQPEGISRLIAVRLEDRKSTRLNSSLQIISYAVFCLKK